MIILNNHFFMNQWIVKWENPVLEYDVLYYRYLHNCNNQINLLHLNYNNVWSHWSGCFFENLHHNSYLLLLFRCYFIQRTLQILCCSLIISLNRRYNGEVGDVVIGRIIEVQQRRWKVETHAKLNSLLMLSSVNLPGGELVGSNFARDLYLYICNNILFRFNMFILRSATLLGL